METADRAARPGFPLGAAVLPSDLHDDPYPTYARLREREPISWVARLGMWFVTGNAHVHEILLDDQTFTTASNQSLIQDTFGANVLTTDGPDHVRYRRPVQKPFLPAQLRRAIEPAMERAAATLVGSFAGQQAVEIRHAFASRLPVQTMLIAFGLPLADETLFRRWYDDFEAALSNHAGDLAIRDRARRSVSELHAYFDRVLASRGGTPEQGTVLDAMVNAAPPNALAADEIKRNLSIIFFGGISTVEALILNAVWALAHHPAILERVRADRALLAAVVDETMRWLSPVQSATRHVVSATTFHGVTFAAGETVNCMLGAANHDPAVFGDPARFDIDRPNLSRQLGFATGPHLCLGSHLAKAEAHTALNHLLDLTPDFRLVGERTTPPEGFEFRHSKRLTLALAKAGRSAGL